MGWLWYTVTMATKQQAIDSLVDWAYSDSLVELDEHDLAICLEYDYKVAGRFPTDAECEELVTGGDDGEPDPKLCALFPDTNDFLATYWE